MSTLCPNRLRELLAFRPDRGMIQFGSDRMLLLRQSSMRLLREQLFHHLGEEMSRSLLMKFGYECARQDFAAIARRFQFASEQELLAAGPAMHAFAGIVQVEPQLAEYDRASGHFHFRGIWRRSYEAENYLDLFGVAKEPVCHSLAGYGSGWCSAFFGSEVLEIETKCLAKGDPHCEWEIRPAGAFGDEAESWRRALYGKGGSIAKELEIRTRELDEINRQLEERVEQRISENRNLLRILCHDLAAPLATLKGLLDDPGERRDRAHDQGTARAIVDAMDRVLTQVREHQARESGKLRLNRSRVDLGRLFDEAEMIFRPRLIAKDLRLVRPTRTRAPLFVWADPISLGNQVINNLLSNAIKFSPRGGKIHLAAWPAGRTVHVEIRDEGIGIPKSLLGKVFSPHEQTSRVGTEGESGTGFGMPLVKQFVEANGGQISVESRAITEAPQPSGTTIRLTFPAC